MINFTAYNSVKIYSVVCNYADSYDKIQYISKKLV